LAGTELLKLQRIVVTSSSGSRSPKT